MTDPIDHVQAVADAGIAVIREKSRTYGASWKARGGRGAWYTLVRPLDRLQLRVERDHGGDIFAAVEADPSGGDGTCLDAIRDLRNYLTLVEAEMVAQGIVTLPARSPDAFSDDDPDGRPHWVGGETMSIGGVSIPVFDSSHEFIVPKPPGDWRTTEPPSNGWFIVLTPSGSQEPVYMLRSGTHGRGEITIVGVAWRAIRLHDQEDFDLMVRLAQRESPWPIPGAPSI